MQRSCAAEQGDCSTILPLALAISVLGIFRHSMTRKMLTTQRYQLWKQSEAWKGALGKMPGVQSLA